MNLFFHVNPTTFNAWNIAIVVKEAKRLSCPSLGWATKFLNDDVVSNPCKDSWVIEQTMCFEVWHKLHDEPVLILIFTQLKETVKCNHQYLALILNASFPSAGKPVFGTLIALMHKGVPVRYENGLLEPLMYSLEYMSFITALSSLKFFFFVIWVFWWF